jgi:hypothetical protein
MPQDLIRFTVTDDHLKLLRGVWVRWQQIEWGAPAIDPKRPYGNGDLHRDMRRLLGWPGPAEDSDWDSFGDEEVLERLHGETRIALQIVLRTGEFQSGEYVARRYAEDWRRADA